MPEDHVKYTMPTDAARGDRIDPISKGGILETSKAINTDWFATNISPTNAPAVHRIQIRLATSSVVKIEFDEGATTNIEMQLNSGKALGANQLYVFDIVIGSGQSYNIQHETGTQNIYCKIVEVNTFI